MTASFSTLFKLSSSAEKYHYALSLLYRELGATHCFIGQFTEQEQRVAAVAYMRNGQMTGELVYSLADTPCADALSSTDVCFFPCNIQGLYPNDEDLTDLNVEGYLGVPLLSLERRPIGILVCLFEKNVSFSDAQIAWFQELSFVIGAELNNQLQLASKDELLKQLALTAEVFENTTEAIMITDRQNRIIRVNRALEELTGYSAAELMGQDPQLFSSGRHDAGFYTAMWHELMSAGRWKGEIYNRRKNGEIFPEELTLNLVRDENDEIINYVAIFHDISEWKENEQRLQFYANQEPLTGLDNRRSFLSALEKCISRMRSEQAPASLLFLGLDRFREVNDLYGPEVGDQVLQTVAKRLGNLVRSTDSLCRYSGDEFTLLLHNSCSENALEVAEKIGAAIRLPLRFADLSIELTASIGVAQLSRGNISAAALLRNGTHAMLSAKRRGPGNIALHDQRLQSEYLHKIHVRDKLKRALRDNLLKMHYQPIIDMQSGRIIKFEALVRWQDAELGVISPGEFIPIAEEFGLIHLLGQFVLDQSCQDLARIHKQGFRDVGMSINRSINEFTQSNDQYDAICSAIEAAGVPYEAVTIEITESVALASDAYIRSVLESLRRRGVLVSLDDFCTGFSSLSNLIEYKADFLKIDKSFTDNLVSQHNHQVLVENLIRIASALNMKVIAEGVETAEQREKLAEYGCHYLQGYLYSPAVSYQRSLKLLMQYNLVAESL